MFTRSIAAIVIAVLLVFSFGESSEAGRPSLGPIIYVSGQALYYDSIITAESLPPRGGFQLLEMDEDGNLHTEFGPGDRGYRGGRWMQDFDGDGVFAYFGCPLLGPGRTEK